MSAPDTSTPPAGKERELDPLEQASTHGLFDQAHGQLRVRLRRFLSEALAPHVLEWERAGALPLRDVIRQLAAEGFEGMRFPAEYGGGGKDLLTHAVLAEELGRIASGGFGMAVTVHIDMVAPMLVDHGSEELCRQFLVPALRGECLFGHAVSEASAGSDVAAVQTSAARDGEHYILDGTKAYVSNGAQADVYCVLARLPRGRPPFDKVLLLVPRELEGVSVGPPLEKMGHRSSDTADVHFRNVRVPVAFRIGGEGMGLVRQLRQFMEERILSACRATAAAAYHLQLARRRCATRSTFGRPLVEHQALRFRLAQLRTDVELSRQLNYMALATWKAGGEIGSLSAMAKLQSSRVARSVADAAIQFSGAEGYLDDGDVARFYRDSRLFSISTGSDEMMLTTIAKLAGFGAER